MGLAILQPGYDPAPQARRDRLRRLATAARGRNPIALPALGASGPGFTCIGGAAGSGLTQLVSPQTSPALFTPYGGSWTPAVSNRVASVTAPGPAAKSWSQRWAWRTDAVKFDINVLAYTPTAGVSSGFRLLIDGQYVSKGDLQPTVNGASNYLEVDWSAIDATPRMRRYDLEFYGDAGPALRGLALAPADVVQPVSVGDRYRIGVLGDSITTGKNATSRIDGYAYQAGKLLGGIDLDLVSISLPGTGYLAAGTGPVYWPFASHLDDLLAQPLDELWIVGGINDSTADLAALQAAALATFRGARTRLPAAPIIVWGVFVNGSQTKALNLPRETTIKAAFDAWADPNSAFVPMQTALAPPQTGYSDQAGNSARYLDTTETGGPLHPIDAGMAMLGSWFAEQRRALGI